jgi:carbon monoxide dehydrogenase subunit G
LTPDTEGGGKHGNLSDTLAIRRPVDDVFAFLADFENIPTWNYAIAQTKKTSPGPVGVGPFTATISYLLAPVGEGTQLTNVVDLESASGAVRLLALLATSRVKAAVAANLDTLKKTLEASGQSVPG